MREPIRCLQCGILFPPRTVNTKHCGKRCRQRWVKAQARTHRQPLSTDEPPELPKGAITWYTVALRDGWECYLCGTECSRTDGKWVDGGWICGPTYPTLDHVVPRSRGGEHTWSNVRLACWTCNTWKNNTDVDTYQGTTGGGRA